MRTNFLIVLLGLTIFSSKARLCEAPLTLWQELRFFADSLASTIVPERKKALGALANAIKKNDIQPYIHNSMSYLCTNSVTAIDNLSDPYFNSLYLYEGIMWNQSACKTNLLLRKSQAVVTLAKYSLKKKNKSMPKDNKNLAKIIKLISNHRGPKIWLFRITKNSGSTAYLWCERGMLRKRKTPIREFGHIKVPRDKRAPVADLSYDEERKCLDDADLFSEANALVIPDEKIEEVAQEIELAETTLESIVEACGYSSLDQLIKAERIPINMAD